MINRFILTGNCYAPGIFASWPIFGNYDGIKLRSNYLHPLRLCNMYFYGIVIDMDDYDSYDCIDIFRNT